MAKPSHSIISPKKLGQEMYLNKPFLGITYPLSFPFLRLISYVSDLLLIINPMMKTDMPKINSGDDNQEDEKSNLIFPK